MRKHSPAHVQVKAAGGVRDLDRLLRVRELGCTRSGATATKEMLDEARRRLGIGPSVSRSRPEEPRLRVRARPQGRHPLRARERLRAPRRSAPRDRRARRGPRAGRPAPGAPRRHRLRQDLHHGLRGRAGESPDARARPQQDARRAALPGVQGLLPGQRRRVLRLVLRLLPARGLRAAVGHLHREGVHDQRGDRPAPPLGDAQPLRAARRPDRGVRLLHLRPGLARGLLRDAPLRRARATPSTGATCCRASWRPATTATTTSCSGAPSGCAATWSRSFPPTRRAGSASSFSATRSSGSATSTR